MSVEAHDVTAERASLPLGGDLDVRGPLAYLASAALHLVLAAAVVLSMRGRGHAQLEADDANRRASTIQDYLTRIAANESGTERPETVPEHHASIVEDEAAPEVVTPLEPEPPPSSVRSHQPRARRAAAPKPRTTEPEMTIVSFVASNPVKSPGSGGTDTVTASNAVCAPKHVSNDGPTCTRKVTVTSLSVPPGCWTDTVIKVGQTGTLTYPCEGDGDAKLSFGSKSFAGANIGGSVDVCTGTEFPWSDGCAWTSAQHVSGSIKSGTLTFGYGEAPKAGQNKQCASSCSASGVVTLTAS